MWKLAAAVAAAAVYFAAVSAGASAAPAFVGDETLASAQAGSSVVAFAPNGFAVAAWLETLPGSQEDVGLAVRPPGGQWSAAQQIGAGGTSRTAPSVAVDANGDAAVAWQDFNAGPPYSVLVSSRPANGAFRAAESVPSGSTPFVRPGVGVDAGGQVTLASHTGTAIATRTFAAGSSALAAVSSPITNCAASSAPVLFSEAPSGDAVAGYSCGGAGFALRRTGTWSVTTLKANTAGDACGIGGTGNGGTSRTASAVAIDSQGHPAAVIEENSLSSPCPGGTSTIDESLLVPVSGKLAVVAGPPAATSTGGSLGQAPLVGPAVGVGGGGLVLTWAAVTSGSTGAPSQVHARFFDAAGGGGSAVKNVGMVDPQTPSGPALAVGLDGHALLAWAPQTSGQPAVVAAAREPGGDFGPQTEVAPGSGASGAPGTAVDESGDGVVTYALLSGGVSGPPHARGFDVTPPTLGAVSIPATATAGAPAAFSATASDFWGPVTFGWSFGDGGTDAGGSPSHVFAAAGPFTSTVTATDAAGHAVSQSGPVQVAAPPPPPSTPVLTGIGETHATFRVGSKPTATAAAAAKRKRAPVGTTFLFTLNEAATVTISIDRAAAGRRSGKRCVKPTRKLARHKRCTRFVHAGTLTRASGAGANHVAFSGRIGKRKLSTGSYRATLVASAGTARGLTKTLHFKIVR
jgi:hypothetical protein